MAPSPNAATETSPLLGSRDAPPEESPSQDAGSEPQTPPWRTLVPIVLTLWTPVFIASLDATVVATLVGPISSAFDAAEQASWLGSSYLLSLCCFNPLVGRMADLFGTRGSLLISVTLFTLGTLGCGMAPNFSLFLLARVVAGAGGGGLTTASNIALSKLVHLRDRGLVQGLTNIVFGLGSGLGGPVGGFCNDLLGWRNAFYLQVPLLAVATFLTHIYIHDDPATTPNLALPLKEKMRRIDFLGSLSLVGCVATLLIPLSLVSGADASFSDPFIYGQFIAAAVLALSFYVTETRIAAFPVLPIRILAVGASVAITNFTLSIVSFASLYTYPLYFQAVRLESSSQAGLHLIPYSIALSMSSLTAGWWMRHTGRYKVYNSFMATLQFASAVLFYNLTANSPEWLTYLAIVPLGIGGAGILTCTLIAIINAVPRKDMALATAMTYLFRTTGQVLGVSISGTILQFSLKSQLRRRLGQDELVDRIRHSSAIIPTLPPEIRRQATQAYAASLKNVFLFLCIVGIVTFLGSLLLKDEPLPDFSKQQQDDGESSPRDQSQDNGNEQR